MLFPSMANLLKWCVVASLHFKRIFLVGIWSLQTIWGSLGCFATRVHLCDAEWCAFFSFNISMNFLFVAWGLYVFGRRGSSVMLCWTHVPCSIVSQAINQEQELRSLDRTLVFNQKVGWSIEVVLYTVFFKESDCVCVCVFCTVEITTEYIWPIQVDMLIFSWTVIICISLSFSKLSSDVCKWLRHRGSC